MPGNPRAAHDERDGLVLYLQQQRDGLRNAAYGLTEEQLRQASTPRSSLTVGGLIKHCALTERGWVAVMTGRDKPDDEYGRDFVLGTDESGASVLALLDEVAAESEAAIAALPDLGVEVALPTAPWQPESEHRSARWIIQHILEELSRHAGHADIIREHIDGATMYELMAGVQGWPDTDWLTPYRLPTEAG